jgi:hypothetical protein
MNDDWWSVIEKLPSENTICQIHSIFGHTYDNVQLINGIWTGPDGKLDTYDCIEYWREQ